MQPGVTILCVLRIFWGFSRQIPGVDFGLGGRCSSRVSKRLHDSSPRKAHVEFESSEKVVKAVSTAGFPVAQCWGCYVYCFAVAKCSIPVLYSPKSAVVV